MVNGGYMSDTLNVLLVVLFVALPGVAGNAIYTRVTGTSWREEPWRNVVRIFGISLGGLILYVLVGSVVNAPLPGYLSLETLDTFALRRTATVRMSIAFLGHFIAAMLVGFAAAKVTQSLDKSARRSRFADGWHEFVSVHANGHWVVVGTESGDIYAGYIQMADPEKKPGERDVILTEPTVYRRDQEKYVSLPYRFLFLSGKTIESVAIASSEPEGRPASMHESDLLISNQEPG
jgi:hypothetical protein